MELSERMERYASDVGDRTLEDWTEDVVSLEAELAAAYAAIKWFAAAFKEVDEFNVDLEGIDGYQVHKAVIEQTSK
jgi:hypothetical protein